MSKTIRFNAFEMNCVGHQSPGLGPIRATGRGNTRISTTGPTSRACSNAGFSMRSSSRT